MHHDSLAKTGKTAKVMIITVYSRGSKYHQHGITHKRRSTSNLSLGLENCSLRHHHIALVSLVLPLWSAVRSQAQDGPATSRRQTSGVFSYCVRKKNWFEKKKAPRILTICCMEKPDLDGKRSFRIRSCYSVPTAANISTSKVKKPYPRLTPSITEKIQITSFLVSSSGVGWSSPWG